MTPVYITPIHNRVLLKRVEGKVTTDSGLIIPENAKEKPQIAVVIAVGPGQYFNGKRIPLAVKPQDVVLFGKYSGQDFEYGGEKYLFALEQELLGVLEGYQEEV